jgi:hypothetical protein
MTPPLPLVTALLLAAPRLWPGGVPWTSAAGGSDAGAAGGGAKVSPGKADTGAKNGAPQLFLASFPVESRLTGSLFVQGGDGAGAGAGASPRVNPNAQVTLRFDPSQARATNELVRRRRVPIGADGTLLVRDLTYPVIREKPGRQQLRPSFVVDFDEAAFKPALDEARASLGAAPTLEQLTRFADKFITKKGWGRGYDIASVVARRREGDCTEHAVLLAALARAFHFPARLVEGLALVETQGQVYAFGHAWVEVYRQSAWHPIDAAFPAGAALVYLPLDLMTDEGAGFALAVTKTGAGTIGVRRVIVAEKTAPPR